MIENQIKELEELVDGINGSGPLNAEDSQILVGILMDKSGRFEQVVDDTFKDLEGVDAARILLNRLKVSDTGIKLTLGAVIVLSLFIESPGDAVIYAYYINRKVKSKGLETTINLDILSRDIIPFGTLTKKDLKEIWDCQKASSNDVGITGNLLDYKPTWS